MNKAFQPRTFPRASRRFALCWPRHRVGTENSNWSQRRGEWDILSHARTNGTECPDPPMEMNSIFFIFNSLSDDKWTWPCTNSYEQKRLIFPPRKKGLIF